MARYSLTLPKKGRPINIQSLGGIDASGLANVISPEDHWKAIIVTAESLVREVLPASSYQAGRVIDDIFIIIDLAGFRCALEIVGYYDFPSLSAAFPSFGK